ncbi:hypothetical protein GCM10027176_38770 [Actinoallomurus bryophytorum]|uniref:DUF4386 family protein n=2 Tax=Actinoallomurus bryophytorum TaxID=1490222 RepID=A0A543CJX2_9ACTN|nr:hypothetical protein FB559_2763 [Actinoallomurus bryophytorum]
MIAKTTASVGGPLFLLGTVLHPARDGWGMAKAGQLYGVTHDIQAAGLLLQALSLAGMLALGTLVHSRRDLVGWYAGLIGTLLWFALIIFDGAHNPVRAHYEPSLVHTSGDIDAGAAIIVFPGLLVFPIGYVLLALMLRRHGMTWVPLLLSVGAVLYTLGGLFIFSSGPRFPLIQVFEVGGATLYALGFILLGRSPTDTVQATEAAG